MMSLLLLLPLALPGTSPSPTAALVQDAHAADLIQRGRELLDAGKLESALELFEQADAESRGALSTRMWVLRVWFAQGRINDAFDQVDALAGKNKGPDLDYLYGMGSYLKAKKYIAENVPDSTTGFALQDAQTFLSAALEANADKYYDAWYPLAEAAWLNQDPAAAEQPAARAVESNGNAETRYLQARILFSLYQVNSADEKKVEQAQEYLKRSIRCFRGAIGKVKPVKEEAGRLADMHRTLGIALQWAEDSPGAEDAYASAIGWNPAAFSFGDYWGSMKLESFTRTLQEGAKQFRAHWGEATNADATLLWWLGLAHFTGKSYEDAEGAFARAVKKWPAYVNSWFYIGMCRYYLADYDGAVLAWREHWKLNPKDLVANVSGNPGLNLPIFAYVQGKCAEKGQSPMRGQPQFNLDAAFLGEVLCAASADNWKFWNDLGLFSRDGGAYLRARAEKGDEEEAVRLFERAYVVYDRAITLSPERPHLYNDQAVLLHYYLERDYDLAMALYEKARDMAISQLEGGELSEEDQVYARTARRDSQDNIEKLKRKLEKVPEDGEGDGDGDGEEGDGQRV